MLLVVALIAVGVHAQSTGTMKAAAPILQQIPDGALGFVAINNLKATAARVEKFMQDIGMGMMMPPGGLLPMVKAKAMLGEGFNANGGLAVVMLDPAKFGLDIPAMIKAEGSSPPPDPSQFPVVLFVPGTSVTGVFGAMAAPGGEYFKVQMQDVTILAKQRGDYVVLSPNEAAIKAVMASKRSAKDALAGAHAGAIAKADLAFSLDMKITGPLYKALMDKMQEQMQAGPAMGPAAAMMQSYGSIMSMYTDMLSQFSSLTVTARLTSDGVLMEEIISFAPGSKLATASATAGTAADLKLNRVPNLPYVIAGSNIIEQNQAAAEMGREMVLSFLDSLNVSPDAQKKLVEIQDTFMAQMTGTQLVIGGAPDNSGVFGVSCVMECKDAAAIKGALAKSAGTIEAIIKGFAPDDPELQQLSISYEKGVEKVGDLRVDAITIRHPEMDEMDDEERGNLRKVMGEEQVRALVAEVDKNTVVVTMGGSIPFLQEAIKAAKTPSRLLSRREDKRLAKILPEKPVGMFVISVGNLLEVIVKGTRTVQPDMAGAMPFNITTKDPIALASGYTGDAVHVVFYVPNSLIREVAQLAMLFTQGMGGGMGGPPMSPSQNGGF